MASPVTAIINPANTNEHLLFYLSGSTGQLALEHRPVDPSRTSEYDTFVDQGQYKGPIVNPSSLASVLHSTVATVYGITAAISPATNYTISTVSPFVNPISTAASATTPKRALAATSDAQGIDYIYYLNQPKGAVTLQLAEFRMVTISGTAANPFPRCQPNPDTSLAACYFRATKDRFIFYEIGDDDSPNLCWVNSTQQSEVQITNSDNAMPKTPLAVTTTETITNGTATLTVYLYYVNRKQQLVRAVGTATGQNLNFSTAPHVILGADLVAATSLLCAANAGVNNYVYYITKDNGDSGQNVFTPWLDDITLALAPPPKDAPK